MTNDTWKTVRVPPEAYERAQEQRQAADRTWGEQIVRPEEVEDRTEDYEVELDLDSMIDTKTADIDKLKSSVETVEERTGRIERQLEQMGAGR